MNLNELAKKRQAISTLMQGCDKVETKDLIGEEISITAVEIVSPYNREPYMVCTYAEDESKFFFAGSVLQNIIYGLMEDLGGIEALNAELTNTPLRIIMEMRQAKAPNVTGRKCNYTAINIL